MNMRIGREWWVVFGLVLVGLLVVAGLVQGIWDQVELLRRIQAADAELAPLVAHAKQRNDDLLAELEHVSSPQYPEEWAREYFGVAGSGEVVLRGSLPEDEETAPSPAVATVIEAEQDPLWVRLWRWMSGNN
jgi:cell division protein FtsB